MDRDRIPPYAVCLESPWSVLTPDLIEQLYLEARTWPLGPHPRDELAAMASSRMLHAVPALVAAAKALPEWRYSNEELRAERSKIREILNALPFEGWIQAAERVVEERGRLRLDAETLREARDRVLEENRRLLARLARMSEVLEAPQENRAVSAESVKTYRCKHAVEALRWADTDENRETFATWFESHGVLFETRGSVIVLPEAGEVSEGEWVFYSDGEFLAMADDLFCGEYEETP